MSRFDLFAKLASLLKRDNRAYTPHLAQLTRKQLKKLRPPRYKPAFSMGHRGFPKTLRRPGHKAAPTIDEVRHRERKYGQKIHIKEGLMFFASDGIMWTKEEAQRRFERQYRSIC